MIPQQIDLSADTCTLLLALLRIFERRFDLLPFSDPSRSNSIRNNRDTNSNRLEVLVLFKSFSATRGKCVTLPNIERFHLI